MPTTIELPQVGESVTEGIIGKWLKQPGDRVRKYDPLVEVITDKVNMEVPSPFSGTLTRTLVAEGDTVPMGAPIAEMDVEGEPVHPSKGPSQKDAEERLARGFEFMQSVRSVGPTGSGERGEGIAATPTLPAATPDTRPSTGTGRKGTNPAGPTTSSGRTESGVQLSPVVRRLVQEHKVDASRIAGTGTGGRVTKEDVLRYVESQPAAAGAAAGEEAVALTPLRKAIAEHTARSTREIPMAWTMMEVDVSGLVAYRDARKDAFQRDHHAQLTYLPMVVHAVVRSLRKHPHLNARWGGDRIFVNQRVSIGIAVATAQGLVVPVVHDADGLSVTELAVRVQRLAEAARMQGLRLDDVQGGTFTVNNTGALGSVASVPIINHPQAAILTTEVVVKRPVVVEDAVVVRSMMNLCLSFDHRVCDGADAAAFLRAVKSRLEAITAEVPLA